MWFTAIAIGIVILIVAWTQAERVRRAGHPALASFAEAAVLPVLGAFIFIALGLAHHDAAWTLAWLLLVYAAGIMAISVAGSLSERVRRAGYPALATFTESASLPVSVACFWVAWGLALHHVNWTVLAVFPLVYAVCAVWRTLRHRRRNA